MYTYIIFGHVDNNGQITDGIVPCTHILYLVMLIIMDRSQME